MSRRLLFTLAASVTMLSAAEAPQASVAHWIEAQGGEVAREPGGNIVEVSMARTWATDNDVERLAELKSLKRLDLSFTYVTDRGIEKLQQLQQLEELNLDTAEFITDAAMSYLRANKKLRKLVLRGTDITDVGLPYIATLTSLRSLDLSYTMLGDNGLESLPALTELEELKLGATRITGLNFNLFKLLPKLRKLNFSGIQRRNGGACWTATITDLDLDPISALVNLEELNLGVGVGLGKTTRKPQGGREGFCHATGGVQITDLGLAKLAKLKKLRVLDLSGARLTPAGLDALRGMPELERLSLWNCIAIDDSSAAALAAVPKLAVLDLSYTAIGDQTLARLATARALKYLYLTDTKTTVSGVETLQKQKKGCFISFAHRPPPIPAAAPTKSSGDSQ